MATSRRQDLETQINEFYGLLSNYERQILISNDPKEKFKLSQEITNLRKQIESWQDELAVLPPDVPADSKPTSPTRKVVQPGYTNFSTSASPAYPNSGSATGSPFYKSRGSLVLIGMAVVLLVIVGVLVVLLVLSSNNDKFVVQIKDTANVLNDSDKSALTIKATNLSYNVKFFTTRSAANASVLTTLVKDELKSLNSPGIVIGLSPNLRIGHIEVKGLGVNDAQRVVIENAAVPFLQKNNEGGAFEAMIDQVKVSVIVL